MNRRFRKAIRRARRRGDREARFALTVADIDRLAVRFPTLRVTVESWGTSGRRTFIRVPIRRLEAALV